MTRTPDEIKEGLDYCVRGNCPACPYLRNCVAKNADALAYIKQLEAERDAVLEIVRGDCVYCLHLCEDMVAPSCFDCANKGYYRWEWRGVQKEE